MKKICLLLLCLLTAFSFTGCNRQEEEEEMIDFEEMDKRLEQNQSGEEEEQPFEDELAEIKAATKEYADYLIKNDAEGYAEKMPEVYVEAIQKHYEYSEQETIDYLAGQIEQEIFEKFAKNNESLSRLYGENGFSVTLSNVSRYSNENAVIKRYKEFGITVTNIAFVNFKITVGDSEVSSSMRFAKLDTGEWKADMSVFKP